MTLEFNTEDLPSRGRAYNVRSISVEKFKMRQIAKMSQAASLNSLAPMSSAMSDCVTLDNGQLTVGDMYYFLAWERCNSYSTPLIAEWDCRGELFQEDGTENTFTHEDVVKLVEEYTNASDEQKENLRNPDDIKLKTIDCETHNAQPIIFSEFEVVPLPDTPLDPLLEPDVRAKREAALADFRNQLFLWYWRGW